jgi:hypothetical protein
VVEAVQEALRCVELLYERESNLLDHTRQREDGETPGHARERLVVAATGWNSEEEEYDSEEDEETWQARRRTGGQRAHPADDPNDIYRQLDPKFDSYPLGMFYGNDHDEDDYEEEYGGGNDLVCRRMEAYRCKEGDAAILAKRKAHRRRIRYRSDDSDFDPWREFKTCGCELAALSAAGSALEHIVIAGRLLQVPLQKVPQRAYAAYHRHPAYLAWPRDVEATDEQLLAAAAEQMHLHLLRPFLRKAIADGHEVLIHHHVG